MLRTRSHLAFCALALSLLGGCSVTIGGSGGGGEPAQPAAQPGKAAPAPVQPAHASPARRPRNPPPSAKRVTSPTLFGNGKEGAFLGLAYVVPENTQRIPLTAGLVPFAAVYTDSFEVGSTNFSGGFPGALVQNEWFLIRYEGDFEIPSAGRYKFQLTADDGAVLYIDNQRVVDNDGTHTAKAAEGEATLDKGRHALRLDYFQAKGPVALQLLMGQAGKLEPLKGVR